MSEPRPLSIEELRRLPPRERARYLGELARANLEEARRQALEEQAAEPPAPSSPPK